MLLTYKDNRGLKFFTGVIRPRCPDRSINQAEDEIFVRAEASSARRSRCTSCSARVLDEIEDLPPGLREEIERMLAG